jgi:hypothetical protein
MQMRRLEILLVSAAILSAAATAAAGSLDFWEDSRGAQDVTAFFPPSSVAQIAHIVFDASSAETGGLIFGASEIEVIAQGSMDFVDWDCELQGCNQSDYVFDPGTQFTSPRPGRVAVSDPDLDPKFGPYDLGTITFNGPQAPGTMPLVNCNYTDLEYQEHSCNQFVLVTLPEPAGVVALLAGAALLCGPLRRRYAR